MPITTDQLSYSQGTFTAELSDLGIAGTPANIQVLGRTGRTVEFTLVSSARDDEGDLMFWTLRSRCGLYAMVLFND